MDPWRNSLLLLLVCCCYSCGYTLCGRNGSTVEDDVPFVELTTAEPIFETTEQANYPTTEFSDTESRQIFGNVATGLSNLPALNEIVPVSGSSCKTKDDEPGVCLPTTGECTRQGGTASGNCNTLITGTAVCCLFVVKSCGEEFVRSPMIWQKPKNKPVAGDPCTLRLPANPSTSTPATPLTAALTTKTCQLRIDFIDFKLAGPNSATVCDKDTFRAIGTAEATPILCGDSYENQHMYLTYNSKQEDIVLTFVLQSASSKDWKLQITRIPCNSPDLVPGDCLQYFTTTSGRIESFNFQQQSLTTSQLAKQDYTICIKKQDGYCSICYEPCSKKNDIPGFALSGNYTTISSLAGGTNCSSDQLIIPAGSNGTHSESVFCGTALNLVAEQKSIEICTLRNRLYYSTDDKEAAEEKDNVGFCLNFNQERCD